jgi:hypothetical protein
MFTINGSKALAMEHIDGHTPGHNHSGQGAKARWDLFRLGFEDMHGMNYMFLRGSRFAKVAPIDLGSPRHAVGWLERADRRAVRETKFVDKVDAHRTWYWKNKEKMKHIESSCPCRCGVLRWDYETN